MSITVAKYTFSSWLRKGIGNRITEPDNLGLGASAVKERSRVPIDVMLNTAPVHKDFALVGPGDIIGLNPDMVVRTEPLNWITNFEPNYLPFIEFYDEDFLWRYTPARANGQRLRPWIALLVLEEGETDATSEFTRNEKGFPLPTVTVTKSDALPQPSQTWAWGHVHINEGYATPTDFEQFLRSLHDLDHPNSDKIISRVFCPRKLKPKTGYHAFVVPAFETGRRIGVDLTADISTIDAQQPSWTAGTAPVTFPVYYDWYFRTGENEDFESLVKLLEPRPMDRRVGIRDIDASQPGWGMTQGADIGPIPPPENPQTILGLEGALKAPTTVSRPKDVDPTKPFFADLKSILNFPADVQDTSDGAADPVVSPPIYGENHANKHRIDPAGGGWLNDLNRDPRLRVPSGFGINVIQKNQEDYVARAWEQVKKILAANRVILHSVFAMETVRAIQTNFVQRLAPAEMLAVFSPVLKKVKGSPTTLFHQLSNSTVPPAAMNSALRRMIRPRGAYGKRLRQANVTFTHARLVEDLNSGRITAAPPKQVPDSVITDERIAEKLPGAHEPPWLQWVLTHRLLLLIIFLVAALLLALGAVWWLGLVVAAGAVVGYFQTAERERALHAAKSLADPEATLRDIQNTPPRSDFAFVVTDPVTPITATSGTDVTTTSTSTSSSAEALHFNEVAMTTRAAAGTDSVEGKNFRAAAVSFNERLAIKPPEPQLMRFDIANAHTKLVDAMRATAVFPQLVARQVRFTFNPDWLLKPEHLIPAMAYPDFPDPMYEKLRDISSELFLPNLELVPPNTISLLVTNPEFIEAYMTGLNHEFGKELLWREYPTDQRGSYFRQFWDVKGIIADDPGLTPEERADRYKDIVPMDTWFSASKLGSHRHPARPPGRQLVLLVRGELLKKYPNTIVYAQKAHIFRRKDGTADSSQDPIIQEVKTEAEMHAEIRFPLFRAEIEPDIRFFGFDMTPEEAKGAEHPQNATDDWGWYFIIQEVPGEPRFGMDIEFDPDSPTVVTWDDLSWTKFAESLRFIDTTQTPAPDFFNHLSAAEKSQWGSHSADMASVLYQKPVMIAVHAKEMLENLEVPATPP